MAESHVVTALVTKRAEMAGLIEHHRKEMGRLAVDLAHLDATLKLFSPEIDLRTLRAKEHRTRNRFFRPGECQRMVLVEGENRSGRDGEILLAACTAPNLARRPEVVPVHQPAVRADHFVPITPAHSPEQGKGIIVAHAQDFHQGPRPGFGFQQEMQTHRRGSRGVCRVHQCIRGRAHRMRLPEKASAPGRPPGGWGGCSIMPCFCVSAPIPPVARSARCACREPSSSTAFCNTSCRPVSSGSVTTVCSRRRAKRRLWRLLVRHSTCRHLRPRWSSRSPSSCSGSRASSRHTVRIAGSVSSGWSRPFCHNVILRSCGVLRDDRSRFRSSAAIARRCRSRCRSASQRAIAPANPVFTCDAAANRLSASLAAHQQASSWRAMACQAIDFGRTRLTIPISTALAAVQSNKVYLPRMRLRLARVLPARQINAIC